MNEKNIKNDILFQIDMQLYDEFNDTIATMNDNLGDIYSLRDVEEVEQAKKDKEIKLLRETIKKQQKEIEKLETKNNDLLRKLRNRIKDVKKLQKYGQYKNEFSNLNKKIAKKDKIIDKIAELIEECRSNGCIESEEIDISEIAGEKNIIDYFTNLVEKENK